MKILHVKNEKNIAGDKWFIRTRELLQDTQPLSAMELKIYISEMIMQYLINAITFPMFVEVIDKVRVRPEMQKFPDIKDLITELFLLSIFTANSENNKESIIDVLSMVVKKIKDKENKQ